MLFFVYCPRYWKLSTPKVTCCSAKWLQWNGFQLPLTVIALWRNSMYEKCDKPAFEIMLSTKLCTMEMVHPQWAMNVLDWRKVSLNHFMVLVSTEKYSDSETK